VTRVQLEKVDYAGRLAVIKPFLQSVMYDLTLPEFQRMILEVLPSLNPGEKQRLFRLALRATSPTQERKQSLGKERQQAIIARLTQYKTDVDKRRANRKADQIAKELGECTFSPRINQSYIEVRLKTRESDDLEIIDL
jgi:hypothetical protein